VLSVRIQTPTSDRIVSRRVSGLTFRKVAGGGHADAQVHLNAPLASYPDLGPDCKLYVYDSAGRTVWEGYTNQPGMTYTDDGEGFDVNAQGIMTLASDAASPVLYRDTSYDSWSVSGAVTPSANASVGTFPDDAGATAGLGCMLLGFNPGQPLGSAAGKAAMTYTGPRADGQLFGAVQFVHDGGLSSSDYKMQVYMGPSDTFYNANLSTGAATLTGYYSTDYTVGSALAVILQHTGAATNVSTSSDTLWLGWLIKGILGTLLDADGTENAPARVDYLLAHEVVGDAVNRFLAGVVDVNRVSIDTGTSYQIDQLAYADPVRLQQIIDDLAVYEPDYTWEITPSGGNGLVGFAYRPWGTTPRYVISTKDGYQRTGSDADLCNRVVVSWADETGKPQSLTVSSSVPALGSRVRYADPVTLPDGQGSSANAQRVGEAVLAAASQPPRSATATIARRILDLQTGRMIEPYDIEPGYLVRVRETGDDLRLTEMSYSHDDLAAQLTLGDPVYDNDQIIAASLRGRRLIPLNSGGTYVAA